jgi:hypothetical protein
VSAPRAVAPPSVDGSFPPIGQSGDAAVLAATIASCVEEAGYRTTEQPGVGGTAGFLVEGEGPGVTAVIVFADTAAAQDAYDDALRASRRGNDPGVFVLLSRALIAYAFSPSVELRQDLEGCVPLE